MSEQRNLIPELLIIFDVYQPITDEQKSIIKQGINDKVKEVFGQKFGVRTVELIIELDEGSLKVKILVALGSLYLFINNYGTTRTGLEYIAQDIRTTFNKVVPIVRQVIGEQNIREELQTEQRMGAIAELDDLIHSYQLGKISHDDYLHRAEHVLEQINQAEDKARLVRELVRYIDARYEPSLWEELATGLDVMEN